MSRTASNGTASSTPRPPRPPDAQTNFKKFKKTVDKGYYFRYNTPCLEKRTISSAGMSIRLTCGGSQVRVLYRPPEDLVFCRMPSLFHFSGEATRTCDPAPNGRVERSGSLCGCSCASFGCGHPNEGITLRSAPRRPASRAGRHSAPREVFSSTRMSPKKMISLYLRLRAQTLRGLFVTARLFGQAKTRHSAECRAF